MHMLAEQSIRIQRSLPEVFAYVSNMENFGAWFPGVISIRAHNALHHGQVGKEYLETVYVPLRGSRKIVLQVKEARTTSGQALFATEGRFPPLLPRMEITVTATGSQACEATYRMFSRTRSPLVRYVLLPLARRVMHKRAAKGVMALKLRMEAD